jgi:hypothetical protein
LCAKVAQWAIAADLDMRYEPLREMKPYSKICIDFSAIAIAQDFVMRY